jgi:hypothetical protein
MPKGIRILVYRSCYDSTNRGLSSRVNEFTLVGDGIDEIFEATDDAPAIRIVNHRTVRGYQYLVPQSLIDAGQWVQMGGNFGWSCDSRVSEAFGGRPMPIHDRVE